jgi:hypothetical protein
MFQSSMSFKVALALTFALSLGCAKDLKSSANAKATSCTIDCDSDNDGLGNNPAKKVEFDAEVQGGVFSAKKVVHFDWLTKTFTISVPLQVNPFIGIEASGTIPEIPGASFKVGMEVDGTYRLTLVIPAEHFLKGFDSANPATLPNGDPLPMVPGGELPYFGLKIDKKKVDAHVYLGASVIAIFVPTPSFDPVIRLTFPLRTSGQRKTVGYFAAIPKKGTFDGGFYVSLMLPDEIARAIEDLL